MLSPFPADIATVLPASPAAAPANLAASPDADTSAGGPTGAFADLLDAMGTDEPELLPLPPGEPSVDLPPAQIDPGAVISPRPYIAPTVPRAFVPPAVTPARCPAPQVKENTVVKAVTEDEPGEPLMTEGATETEDVESPKAPADLPLMAVPPVVALPVPVYKPAPMLEFSPATAAPQTEDSAEAPLPDVKPASTPAVKVAYTPEAQIASTPELKNVPVMDVKNAPAYVAPAYAVPTSVEPALIKPVTVQAPQADPVAAGVPLMTEEAGGVTVRVTDTPAPKKGRGAVETFAAASSAYTAASASSAPALAQPAQISAPASTPSFQGGESDGSKNKNRFQPNDEQVDAVTSSAAGTARAYDQASMSSPANPFATPAVTVRAAEAMTPPAPAAAARLVERVAEVAQHMASRPSEPVSLSIQLDDTHRVDVRVTMRDGQVHTAFRSDSPEVRAALSSAWEGFVRSRDGAEQRWAEPVFSAAGSSQPAAPSLLAAAPVAGARSEAGLTGSGQEQARQQAQEPRRETFFGRRSPGTGSTGVAAISTAGSTARPDTSHHLSVVA